MSTFIVRQAFLTFTVGQVVYSDADATGRPAMSVITDAQVAGHTAALVSVSSSGGGTSTGGTSTTGTGTSGSTAPAGVYIVSATPNSDGSITFVDSTGASHTSSPATAGSLTTQQAQQLAATSNIVNSSGQVTAAVVGDVSSATVGGVTEAVLASTIGSHTSHFLTIDSSLTSIAGSQSAVGTTVTAHTALLGTHTAQLGTLATGLSSTGSAASAAGTLAMSASSSVSTLGTAVSAHTGSLTALGTLTASHSSSLSSLGTQATSLAGSVSSLGTQVAQAKPITGSSTSGGTVTLLSNGATLTSFAAGGVATAPANAASLYTDNAGVIRSGALTASTSGTQTTLTNPAGQTVAVVPLLAGPQGPAGTLGNGEVSGNFFTTLFGGKARLLADFLGNIRTSYHFGTQNNGNTVQQVMGFNSRADAYNYQNSQGNRPYAFMQDYPVSQGDDICVFVPPGNAVTTPTTTVHLTQNYTLPTARGAYTDANGNNVPAYGGPVGLYTGVDGYSYLYVSDVADVSRTFTYNQPISDNQGKLAAGSIVLSTQGNCIRITTQPSGTTLGTGAVITVGTPPTSSMVGQQVFAPQGLKAPRNRSNPFPKITAVNVAAGTITLSSALYVSSQSNGQGGYTDGNTYGNQITGLQPLSVLYIFTPVAESAITSTMTMDDLAGNAVVFNSRTGDQSHDVAYFSTGDHIQGVPWYWWDVTCSVFGAHSQATYIRTGCSSYAAISYFPKMTAIGKISGLSIYTLNGNATQHAGLYIEGAGETQPSLNNLADIKISFEVTDINTAGPVQGVRLRHIGGEWLDALTHVGKDLTTLNPSATLVCHNVVYARVGRLGAQNCGAAWLWEGYGEHGIIENGGDVSCASFFDNDLASTVNGVGMLIMEVKGTDMDVQFFGARFAFVQSLIMVGQEVQFPNPPRAMLPGRSTAPILSIEGCNAGEIAHIFGGAATPGNTDLIQVKARSLNGGTQGTSGISFSHLGGGLAASLRIDAGCNGNRIFDATIAGTIVDNGSNTHVTGGSGGGSASLPSDYADAAADYLFAQIAQQNVGTGATTLVCHNLGACPPWNDTNQAYTTPYAGVYEIFVAPTMADTGTAAVTGSTPYNAASPAGTRFYVVFNANGNALISKPFTTQPKSTDELKKHAVYTPAGTVLSVQMLGDAAGLVMGGQVTIRCVERTG